LSAVPSSTERVRALLSHPAVTAKHDPAVGPQRAGEPDDLAALYAQSDGLELADGTRILGRSEVAPATTWLKEERSLSWDDALLVVGERDDLVIVRDRDPSGSRAGGGVLEAPTDGLSRLARTALDLLGYLEDRLGLPPVGPRAPEREARAAVGRGDAAAIARAIARPFYPGAERELAHAALTLGVLRATAGDPEGALQAFAEAVASRVAGAPRGEATNETRAGWKTCAVAAEKAGAHEVGALCRAKAGG
jgi:hypothetical protein